MNNGLIQVGTISDLAEASLQDCGKVVEDYRAIGMAPWSELQGALVMDNGLIQVGTITDLIEASFQGTGKVVDIPGAIDMANGVSFRALWRRTMASSNSGRFP